MLKLGAEELRLKEPTAIELAKVKRNPIYILLDNILDTYNVGAIFRLADAVASGKVFLCGETAIPTDPKVGHKIQKASVGTWKWVEWQHVNTVKEAIQKITNHKSQITNKFKIQNSKSQITPLPNHQLTHSPKIISIEQRPKAIPYDKVDYSFPLVLIVGNETSGVSEEALKLSDAIVEIPMFGVNKSLNVMVSLAIVLWKVIEKSVRVW